jgi:hypothetical protein
VGELHVAHVGLFGHGPILGSIAGDLTADGARRSDGDES